MQWLVEQSGLPFDYDMIVVDELSSFKSYQAKALSQPDEGPAGMVKRIVGLTGTPSANGLDGSLGGIPAAGPGQAPGAIHHPLTGMSSSLPDKRNGQQIFTYKSKPGRGERNLPADIRHYDLHEDAQTTCTCRSAS